MHNAFQKEIRKKLSDVVMHSVIIWPFLCFSGIYLHFLLPTLNSRNATGQRYFLDNVLFFCVSVFALAVSFLWNFLSSFLSLACGVSPYPPSKQSANLIWAALNPLHFLCSFNMLLCFSSLLHCNIFPFACSSHFWQDWSFFSKRIVFYSLLYLNSCHGP